MTMSRRHFIQLTSMSALALGTLRHQAFAKASESIGLKDLYADDFLIGTMIEPQHFVRRKQELLDIVVREFNSLSTENVFKWENIHPTEQHWNWVYADAFVEFGQKHNMHLLGHPLLWHAQLPVGLFIDRPEKPITRELLLSKIETHVGTLVDRYRGRIHTWDVVNEAFDEKGRMVSNRWLQVVGPDYLSKAFEFAREADPKAKLLYNDYNLWRPEKRNTVIQLIRSFRHKGIPIDGIGMQGHVGLDYPEMSELGKSIEAFSNEGVEVHISELEVDVLPSVSMDEFPEYRPDLDPYRNKLPKSVSDQLAKRYETLFTLLLKHRERVARVSFWGTTDDQSWKNDFPIPGRTNHTLLFDRQLKPKLAYDAIAKLKQ